MSKTKIEWTEHTWNPIVGCSVVSPGCTNCYAMKKAGGRLRNTPAYEELTEPTKAGPVWNGTIRLLDSRLTQPLRWRKPRMIFVNSMGDLFHENVPYVWIDMVFAVMALSPRHTFQVLTKRAGRMRDYMNRYSTDHDGDWVGSPGGGTRDGIRKQMVRLGLYQGLDDWPLPNVWLGISAENQAAFDARARDLGATPAAIRFISFEPLLGEIDTGNAFDLAPDNSPYAPIDWAIVGGESGKNARPMHPDWARGIRDQCRAAGVPFFFKQWGEWGPHGSVQLSRADRDFMDLNHSSNGLETIVRVGKKRAGSTLDGEEHKEMPEVIR